jgi:hypothetical protein
MSDRIGTIDVRYETWQARKGHLDRAVAHASARSDRT